MIFEMKKIGERLNMLEDKQKNQLKSLIHEKLAELGHQRWARWQAYVFSISVRQANGEYAIPEKYVREWQQHIQTAYQDLPEAEKERDRKEALKTIEILAELV